MTTREDLLDALVALLATDDFFPPAALDEPEPSSWTEVASAAIDEIRLTHALAVQDGPPPEAMARARGPEGAALDELELEAAIAYGVQAEAGAGSTVAQVRAARRARRDEAVTRIAALIAANRNLGLPSLEIWAEVAPAQREDEVAFTNATAAATAVVPVRILYTAAHAAD
jgi:hypothetical protein